MKAPPGDDNKGTAGFQPLSQRYKNTYDTPKWPARTSNNMALSKAKGTLCSQGVNRRRDSHSGSTCTTGAMSTTVYRCEAHQPGIGGGTSARETTQPANLPHENNSLQQQLAVVSLLQTLGAPRSCPAAAATGGRLVSETSRFPPRGLSPLRSRNSYIISCV